MKQWIKNGDSNLFYNNFYLAKNKKIFFKEYLPVMCYVFIILNNVMFPTCSMVSDIDQI